MTIQLEKILSVLLTLSAVAIAGVFVHREFANPVNIPVPDAASVQPEYKTDWTSYVAQGTRIGPEGAPITLVEFSDYQCPACARFQTTVSAMRKQFGDQVAVIIVHFPLPMHRFAAGAAQAADCAAKEGKFDSMSSVLFGKQDSLGIKSWASYASEASVADAAAFDACARQKPDSLSKASIGARLAMQLKLRATPTILLNGWQFSAPPREETLAKAISALLAGKKPFGSESQLH